MLKLSFKSKIAEADIAAPPEKSKTATDIATFTAGAVERRANKLFWFPAPNFSASAQSLKVGSLELQLSRRADGGWVANIGEATLDSNIARICLVDGRASCPMIIASPEELMRFAPFPIADSLRRKLDAVLNGDADLIGLAREIHLLVEDDGKIGPSLERIHATGRSRIAPSVAGRDFATSEEFRTALNLKVSMKSAGFAHGENPALQSLLQIVLRGMVNIDSIDKVDADAAATAKGLDLGEDQDDTGLSDDEATPAHSNPASDIQTQTVSVSEFQRNQTALWHGIGQFQDFLARSKESEAELDLNFITRSLFMLYLMLHGCTKQYQIEEGETEVLIPFAGDSDDDFRDSFLFVAAQSIAAIWGPNFARSLIGRLNFKIESDVLPIQITTLTIITRWVLAAILAEVRRMNEHKSLREILEKQVPKLFSATRVFPELGQDEMLTTIRQMQENIGMDEEQGTRIRETLRELAQNSPTVD